MYKDEEYELSECASRAISFHYPETLKPDNPMFEKRMIELQLALIECHSHTMYKSDLRRAVQTTKYLKQRLKEC